MAMPAGTLARLGMEQMLLSWPNTSFLQNSSRSGIYFSHCPPELLYYGLALSSYMNPHLEPLIQFFLFRLPLGLNEFGLLLIGHAAFHLSHYFTSILHQL